MDTHKIELLRKHLNDALMQQENLGQNYGINKALKELAGYMKISSGGYTKARHIIIFNYNSFCCDNDIDACYQVYSDLVDCLDLKTKVYLKD